MGSACYCICPQDEVCTPSPCLSCSLCSLPRGHLQEFPPIHGRLQLPHEVLGREERGEAFCWDRGGDEEVPRSKRQVEELKEFQETNEEFILQFGDFQDGLNTMMGNLSCVLKTVQWLKEDGEANLEPWTTGLTDPPEGGFEFDVEGAAATDLAWRERMSNSATECHELAEAIPAKSLTHDPPILVLGRAAIFFKCMNKVERRLCAEAEMLEFLEKVYGPTETETLQELGLPENKYAAAGIAAAVLSNAESPEERFVDEFMWRLDDNL